jgi:hypothetical protein
MTRLVFTVAFLLGAAAIVMMGANFIGSNTLALVVTAVIGGVYAIGVIELLQFHRATATLTQSLAALSEDALARLTVLGDWLIKLHPSLQHAVRQRIEGDRIALPAPVLTPYLVSLLVMLGLLGTFVGLVETLKGVVVALEGSSDLEAIRQALTAPMGGLGLAFGTSVAGVAASAMLGLMSTLSRRDRMLATRELDGKITTVLRRFSNSHKQQETFEALQLQSQSLPAIADKLQLVADHVGQMAGHLGEQLTTNQHCFHESVQVMYRELAASVEKSLRGSVEKSDRVLAESGRLIGEGIQPIVQEAMVAISAKVNQGVQNTHQQLSRTVQDQLQVLSGDFAKTTDQVTRAWQDGLTAHSRSNEALIQGMQGSFVAFSDQFARGASDVLDSVRQTTSEWGGRQEAAEAAQRDRWIEALQQTQQQAAAQLERASTAVMGELRTVSETHQSSIESLVGDVATVSSELMVQLGQSHEQAVSRQQSVIATLEESARSMTEDAQAGSTRMLSEIGRLLSTSEALIQTRIDTETAWLEGHDQRMGQLTAGLRNELAALREEEMMRGQAAVDRLAELESTVTANLSTLGKALEEPMTRLIQTASETPRAAAEVIGQLRQEISNNIERDNQLLEERSRLMTELDAVTESLTQTSAGQAAAIERLVDSSAETLKEVGEQFAQRVEAEASKASEVADDFAVSAAEISSLGEAFKVAVDLHNASNNQLIESLRRIESALERSTTRSDEQLGYYVAQAREVIDYSVQTQRELFDDLRQLRRDGVGDDRNKAEVI